MTMSLVEAFAAVAKGPAQAAWAVIHANVEKHARHRARQFSKQRSSDEAEELAGEIVLRLVRAVRMNGRIPCDATDEAGCQAFLHKVITNRDLDRLRKARRQKPLPEVSQEGQPEEEQPANQDEPAAEAESIELRADATRLNELIERLRHRAREERPKQYREHFDRNWEDAELLSARGYSVERLLREKYRVTKDSPEYDKVRNTNVDRPQPRFRDYLHEAVQTGEQTGVFSQEEAALLRHFIVGFCSSCQNEEESDVSSKRDVALRTSGRGK